MSRPAWPEPSRLSLATRVFFASLLLGGVLLTVFSLIEAPWRVRFSPISQPWWYLVILVVAVDAALLAAICAARLRRFSRSTQQLLFGGLFSASVLVLLFLFAAVSTAFQCASAGNCHEGYLREVSMAGIWVLYFFVLLALLPSLLFGISSLGIARWSLSATRASRFFWPACVVVAICVAAFALLTQLGVFSMPHDVGAAIDEPAGRGPIFGPGESSARNGICTQIGSDGVEREIDCPVAPSGEQHGLYSAG